MFPRQTNKTRTIFVSSLHDAFVIFSINNQQLVIKEIDTNLIRLQTSVNENDKKNVKISLCYFKGGHFRGFIRKNTRER